MSEIAPKGESKLLQEAKERFAARFGREPTVFAAAPGRVNLIGEHVDYCEGFVLPVALSYMTLVVGSPNDSAQCRVLSVLPTGKELETSFSASDLKPGEPAWSNYVKGVVANFPGAVQGFDAVIVGDIPLGAGLSSSASLEVAFFTLLEGLSKTEVNLVRKAKLCQKAEHEFPGMPCGIMDQYIVTLGKKNHALLIDCRSLEAEQVPLEIGDAAILVINSNVKHQLTGSEYPQRRAQTHQAAQMLGLQSLRDATLDDLEELKRQNCDELVLKRARHVIEEIKRTEEFARALKNKEDLIKLGELLYRSHDSLSSLMEVSCPELDSLVSILRGVTGVYGARMTGGGFGGCVVALVQKSEIPLVKARVILQYKGTPTFIECEPSDGARIL